MERPLTFLPRQRTAVEAATTQILHRQQQTAAISSTQQKHTLAKSGQEYLFFRNCNETVSNLNIFLLIS